MPKTFVSRLNQEPSLSEFVTLTQEFTESPRFRDISAENLEFYTTILQKKLVHLFIDNEKGLASLRSVFGTPAGLGCLTSQIQTGSAAEVNELLRLIALVLENLPLTELLSQGNLQIVNLLWGSRLLNASSSRPLGDESYRWLGDLRLYSSWLAMRMLKEQIVDARLFDKGLKLGAPKEFFKPLLEDLNYLKQLLQELRPAQIEYVEMHGLIPLLPEEPSLAGRILIDLELDAETFMRVVYKLPASVNAIRASIILARERGQLASIITELVAEWSQQGMLLSSSILRHQALTQLLIGSSLSLTVEETQQISHSAEFTEGISNHLMSSSTPVRELGPLVAEVFAKRSGEKLDFNMTYTGYAWWVGRDELAEATVVATALSSEQEPTDIEAAVRAVLGHKGSDSGEHADSNADASEDKADGDSDDEEIDDEEDVDPPYYLKDLVTYLQSDKYGEVLSALQHGSALILRKAAFGSEVKQYADQVLSAAGVLSDNFSINGFTNMRQAILNAVVTADPDQAPALVRLFVSGDWSLAQRQSLLATLAYAAHSLAKGEPEATHEALPNRLHKLFLSDGDRILSKQIEQSPQSVTGPMRELSHRKGSGADDLVALNRESATKHKNTFSRVSNKFFFPLLAAQPPLRQSSYDAIVYAQWLRTLGLIVVEAYPTEYMPEMVSESWSLFRSLLEQMVMRLHESVLLEALYASMNMVISVGSYFLVQNFPGEIGIVFDQVMATMRDAEETNPQAAINGRMLASHLAQLIEQINSRVLGSS